MSTLKLVVVIIYVLAMLLVGYLCRHKTKTVSDFFLGGRTLGPWLSAFAYGATYFSAVLFIGYAGKLGWGFGLHSLWIVLGNAIIGVYLAWKVLGYRTRTMTARMNAMTMPEFLAVRYDCQSLKAFAAIIVFVFLVPYSASVYMGLSYLFEVNLNMPYHYALAFMAILTAVYLIMGGYMALAITDLIQGIVVLFGVIVMVFFLVSQVGGPVEATTSMMKAEYAPALMAETAIPGWVTLLSLVIITSFGPWGLPQMVQKFYSIKSETQINRAAVVCTIFALIMAFGAYYTGALTHLFYDKPPGKIDELIPRLLTDFTPDFVSMVILLLVISASMSSLSSLVLVSSSAIAIDLYSGFISPNASKKTVVTMLRIFCGVFILSSLVIALMQPTIIVNLMVISWGALSGAFIAPYLYGLYWKRATKSAAVIGLLSGVGTAVFLFNWWGKPGIPLASTFAIAIPLIVMPIVSMITPAMSEDHINKIFNESKGEGVVN